MKNITPVILVMLMLTSYLACIDFNELEEEVVIEDTGARSGADATVIAITTPKETTCNGQNCRNTLQVDEEVSFSAYIKNAGDTDITELTYSVSIYLTDSSQTIGNLAKDASGNDLVWTNLDAMCDDGSVCDFDSTTDPLAAGAYLGGGKLTLQRNGADIIWTPTTGEYMVEVAVESPTDVDTANNAEYTYVKVEDWYDVKVELAWIDGNGDEMDSQFLDASSLTSAEFKLTVTADGSEVFNPREVNIRLETSGQVASATLSDGTDVMGINSVIPGTDQTVETFHNETDLNATQTDIRAVLSYQNAWSISGSLVPNGDANAQFAITAEVIDYTMYGPFDDCTESTEATEGNENVTTWMNSCEVIFSGDDRPRTDADELTGSKVTYDDIRISRMGIYQGYNSDCTGVATSFTQQGEDGDLNVGCSLVYADVEHRGSDPTKAYGWNVSYSVSLDGTTVAEGVLNECTVGVEMPYTYSPLGGGSPVGAVCMQTTLEPGEYTFDMMLNMDVKNSNDTAPEPWSGGTDQRTSNNDATMVIDVINNLPVITSFELTTEGDIVMGQEDPLVFAVSAFDVDDPSGDGLTFAYSFPGGEIGGCSGTQAEGATVCTTIVLPEYIGNSPVTVVVTDAHMGQASKEIDMFVWNSGVATATSDSGVTVQYSLEYNGQSEFNISSFADADVSTYDAVQLEGFTGTYAAVGAIDYAPSTTYTANDVLDQSISVKAPKDLQSTSLWYIDGSGKWILLDDTAEDTLDDATLEVYTYDVPENSPVVPAGMMILMGGELAQATVPDASVSGFSAAAAVGGAINMNWDITGTLLSSDSIVVGICPVEADCSDEFEATVADEVRTYTYSGSQTTHGETYHVEVAVCNEQGCSTPGIASVVADKRVDGGAAATDLVVEAQGDQWVLSWTVSGDTSDVAMWHVCYQTEDFTVAEMPSDCPNGVAAGVTTITIDMPAVRTGQDYYFTAVPMDALGNMDAAASMNSIKDTRVADNSNTNDGTGTIGDGGGDDTSSSVPGWTWGLIGGVVVVAFVVGAFILSRGDGEDGEGKDWDY